MKINLKDKLNKNFFKTVVSPMLLITVPMIILLNIFSFYIFSKLEHYEINKANNIFQQKQKKDGRGLGLYMPKTIVEKHCGGKLSVSNSDEGAIFKIELVVNT